MRYELLDTTTSEVVVEADTMEAVAEVMVELRESGAGTDSLVLLRWVDGQDHPSLVE